MFFCEMEDAAVNVERLKAARTASGLTLDKVATAIGLGASSLSEYENGHREPRLAQLRRLAELYQRSVVWFLEEGAPAEPLVLWRNRPPEPEVAAATERRFLRLCEMLQNLERWCGVETQCTLPCAAGSPQEFSRVQAEDLASRVLRQLSLGDRPALTLLPALEDECGVSVFHLPFEPTGTAACSLSEHTGHAILLNSGNVRWRRNFDLAHELFHLLTWQVFRQGENWDRPTEREEDLATAFASALLMPADPFLRAVDAMGRDQGRLRYEDVFEIARRFDVSHEAVLWRLKRLYKRSSEETERDIQACRRLRPELELRPSDEDVPPERPAHFRVLVNRALRSGDISIGRAAEYLGVYRHSAALLANYHESADDAIALDPA